MNLSIYSQEVQNWIKDINRGRGCNPRLVMEACARLEAEGIKTNDDALVGFACFSRGENYYLMNDMDNFCIQMQKSQEPLERIGEWGYLAVSYNMLGIMAESRGNAPFAMDLYIKGMSLCEEYALFNIAWMIHMNMGAMYLNIKEFEKAIIHLENAYNFIITHADRDDFYQVLTACYMGIGKAYMNLGDYILAEGYKEKIYDQCLDSIEKEELFVVKNFEARLAFERGNNEQFSSILAELDGMNITELPLVDYFDEIFDYLNLLLEARRYNRFSTYYETVAQMARKTRIKNIQKRMLSLKIRAKQSQGLIEESKLAAMEYFDVCQVMEAENRQMIRNMVDIRNDVYRLKHENDEAAQRNRLLQRKSQTDALTGIANRACLNEYGEQAFNTAYLNKTSFAIEILDIDYFKEYNDNYGHQMGDEIIRMVAQEMQNLSASENIFCARYGGDEFIMIFEGMTKEQVQASMQEMKLRIHAAHVMHAHSPIADRVTVSQGGCWSIPGNLQQLQDYLHVADENLYKVKRAGKNDFCLTSIAEN